MNMFSFKEKVIVVTGGGNGIGKSISRLFAQQGGKVFILDINGEDAWDLVHEIRKKGQECSFIKCNIAAAEEVNMAIHAISQSEGKIDVVINNAAIAHVGCVETTTLVDFDKLLAVNVKGVFHVIRASIPAMKERGGVILNMASVAASVGLPDRFAYSATKGAITGITLSVARDYLSSNIRCNSISPARVHTPFVDGFIAKNYPGQEKEMFDKLSKTQPIGRMANPDEIAFLALYLCSDEASFITGCDYPIDGGFTTLNN